MIFAFQWFIYWIKHIIFVDVVLIKVTFGTLVESDIALVFARMRSFCYKTCKAFGESFILFIVNKLIMFIS